MSFTLVSIHTMDPRGSKVGGIETHIRHLVRHCPLDVRLVMVGVDELGDLAPGRASEITIDGRKVTFLPLMQVDAARQNLAAASLSASVTLRFALKLFASLPALRRLIGKAAVIEVERLELVLPAKLLGHPVIALLHNEGQRGDKMDSILGRHWWVHEMAEWLAVRLASRLYCVTAKLAERVAGRHPQFAARIGVRTVSVDRDIFAPAPFNVADGRLRLVFAGRLDAFKDPPLMFEVAARLNRQLGGAFEFHYCGASDPTAFAEFAEIAPFTHRHGALSPRGVAAVMRSAHIGILTSYYEGMPCFLLELLAAGRPFAGVHLPQFDQVVRPGESGAMVERMADRDATADAIAATVNSVWCDIRNGRYRPELVAATITPFAVDRQLADMFTTMRGLATGAPTASPKLQIVPAGE